MANIKYRDYYSRSYRYSRERKIWKRCNNRYVLTGLPSKGEAERIRQDLVRISLDYGIVTLADVYDIAGVEGSTYIDNKIGWDVNAGIHLFTLICYDEISGWYIEFPETNWDSSRDVDIMKKSNKKPEPIHITINTQTINSDNDNVGSVFEYVHAITDREVYISVI